MKLVFVWLLLLLTSSFAQPPTTPLTAPRYDTGTIISGSYSNQCFGFSFFVPFGWDVDTKLGPAGKAFHLRPGEYGLLLLHRANSHAFGDAISLTAVELHDPLVTVKELVQTNVQSFVKLDSEHRQVLREAYPVTYGGQQFYRSDDKQSNPGMVIYLATVATRFRGYLLYAAISASSPERLEESVSSLQQITFQDDVPNPACITGGENPAGIISGVIGRGGIIGPSVNLSPGSPSSSSSARLMPIVVSHEVAEGLLIHKIDPIYPATALRLHTEGRVVMKAEIDKNGDVKDVTLVSGDPLLAPAAIDAVKLWKYKPYMVQGLPVGIETLVAFNFRLHRK